MQTEAWRDRVIDMAINGVAPGTIAETVGVGRDDFYAVLSRARRKGMAVPRFTRTGEVRAEDLMPGLLEVPIGEEARKALNARARENGMAAPVFARRLLELVVRHRRLVDALMQERWRG